jgi:hypothetical protein
LQQSFFEYVILRENALAEKLISFIFAAHSKMAA